jgi:hypothetical protein
MTKSAILANELDSLQLDKGVSIINVNAEEIRKNNLLVIYGLSFQKASPVKLRGAITEDLEDGCILLVPAGHEVELYDEDEKQRWREGNPQFAVAVQLKDDASERPNMVKADVNDDDVWEFETSVPHDSFMLFNGDDLFCVGIIIDMNDLDIPKALPAETNEIKWLEIDPENLPENEVLAANFGGGFGYKEKLIGYILVMEEGLQCESDHELLQGVTHYIDINAFDPV